MRLLYHTSYRRVKLTTALNVVIIFSVIFLLTKERYGIKMTQNRSEIPAEYKWDLSAIYPDMDAFDADYNKVKVIIDRFHEHEKTMNESAEGLLAMLKDDLAASRLIEKLFIYAHLNSDTDKSNNEYLALMGRMMNLAVELGSVSYFVSPSLVRLDDATLDSWYNECEELRAFRRTIESARRYKPYKLSDENEKLLAQMQSALGSHSDIRSIFANADMTFGFIKDENGKKVQLTDANYGIYLMSSDRRVRRAAFKKVYETYRQFGNTFASLMNAYVRERTAMAKARGYESSLQASVFNDEVTPDIYNNLIDTVNENLDVLYDYYDLKKEVLGLSQYHLYDVYTPLIESCSKEYTFEEAVEETLDAVKILGEDYHRVLEEGIKTHRWCDVYPSKGKTSGAYSSGCYDTQPYMLLNYTGKLDDISTLAHEAGHSMHSYLSRTNNPPQDSQYTIFVAEVASTVNELLFSHKKLRESESSEEKLSILNQIMETYKGTLFRQTMFAEFEKFLHESVEAGATLTQDLLNTKYYEIVKRYFGKNVVCDEDIALEWMRIPHFYRWFYVYKYATCISAASSIVKRIETEGEPYIKKYLEFLSAGGSKSPLDSLLICDIDMTKPEVIRDAIADFKNTIEQFREIYKK